MADRVLTWHIPEIKGTGRQGPTFYVEDDYEEIAVRVHAETAPVDGELQIDILDDDVSIFNNKASSRDSVTENNPEIEFHGLTGLFSVNETITGGTSSATAKILSTNNIGHMELQKLNATAFSTAETITGASSAATATVDKYVPPSKTLKTISTDSNTYISLEEEDNTEEMAEDFNSTPIEKGSWVSLNIGKTGGANNITVHLELKRLSDPDEDVED